MQPSPLTSPRFRTPQTQGFQELPTSSHSHWTSGNSSDTMDPDTDIPLAPMRSNASLGARRPNQGGVGPEIYRLRSAQDANNADSNASGEKNGGIFQPGSRPIGRRRVKHEPEAIRRQGSFDSEDDITFMGRLYSCLVAAPPIIRYIVYVLPVAFLLAIPLVVLPVTGNAHSVPLGYITTNSTTVPPTRIDGPPLFHLFVWIEASWAGFWAGKIVAHLVPIVFVFFCGVISSGTRKYATILVALEGPLSLFFWALITWLVFRGLFSDHRLSWVSAIHNILGSVFVSSAVFLAERTVIQLMSIGYHQRSFAGRIKDSKRDIHLLGLMYDASRALFPMYGSEFAEEDYIINDSIQAMLRQARHRHSGSKPSRTTTAAPRRLIGGVGRIGDKFTSAFGNLASEITGKQMFNPNSAHSIVVEALEKVRSSEALARRIWMSFVVEDNGALYPDDILEVMGPAHKEEAEECFAAIDADGNGDISLDEMIRKVVAIGKERHAMANSMKDIGSALAAFDSVLLFLVLLVVIFIFLAFFQSSFITTLATAGTALLSLSFVFAVSAQEVLGSCIFLFVKHPFDVGDRVDIWGHDNEQLVVEKISLLYTVFTRIDRMQTVQIPNIVLNTLWIENVSRSNAMREVLDINVSFDTSFEDIELLRLEMEKFVRHPDNARDFQPDLSIGVAGVGDLDKLQLKVAIKHKSNWHNDQVRATRRSKFVCALALALKKVPIYAPGAGEDPAGAPANPTYSVTVSDAEAAAAREKAAREKNKKRMVPVPDPDPNADVDTDGASCATSTEKQAVRELNTVDPLADVVDNTPNEGGLQAARTTSTSSGLRNRAATSATHSTEIDALHSTVSQRGRRQAGQGLLAMPSGEEALARYASSAASSRQMGVSLDLERGGSGEGSGEGGQEGLEEGVAYGAYDNSGSFNRSRNMPPPPPPR